MLDKAIRELDRERTTLQNQEKKLIGDIKKSAKAGQMVRSYTFPFLHVSDAQFVVGHALISSFLFPVIRQVVGCCG